MRQDLTREELKRLVTDTTIEVYEDFSSQLIGQLEHIKHDENLTEAQKNDEVMLDLMGYVKSCTNEIMIQVLTDILEL